jgi:hypothetical protein
MVEQQPSAVNPIAQRVVERNLVTPQQDTEQEVFNGVSIIRGLSTENDLIKIELRLRGYTYNVFKKVWVRNRRPIMNELGVGNFIATLQGIGDVVNFSHYLERDVPKLALMFFEDNFPQFLVYAEDFELSPKDFNVIKTILKFWTLSVLNNAKGAGHRNVVRGTLSEGILAKALAPAQEENKKGGFFSFLKRTKPAN